MKRIVSLGMGNRAGWLVKELQQVDPGCVLAAVADPDEARARGIMAQYPLTCADDLRVVPDADELLDGIAAYDGVIIATWCVHHTRLAEAVAATGIPVFLEKPVALSEDEIARLGRAYAGRESQVIVSFPLRCSPLFEAVRSIVRSGRLGLVNQVVAWNYVYYGYHYYTRFYRDLALSNGLWLQKATHDLDCINALLEHSTPTHVMAMSSRQHYGGHMPDDLLCSACALTATCPESPENLRRRGDLPSVEWDDHLCSFSAGKAADQDAGSALVRYADGSHASYTQNMSTRRRGRRGMTLTGYLASLDFDWYTDTITVRDHLTEAVEESVVTSDTGHFGGDRTLLASFHQMMSGTGTPVSTLEDGIRSAAVCLAASRSCVSGAAEPVTSASLLVRGSAEDVPHSRGAGVFPPATAPVPDPVAATV